MKQFLYIIASLLLTAGCTPEPSQDEVVKLSVDKTSLEFTGEGGEQTFTVTASEQVFLVPGDGWVTAKKGNVSADHKTVVTVTAQKNTVAQARETKISVVAGEEKMYVEVSQEAGEASDVPGQGGSDGGNQGVVVPENDGNLAWQMSDRFGMGWNMGNHFDAHNNGLSGETFWGNPKATQATFEKVRAAGFKTVRIPVTWLGQYGDAPEYKINDAWLDRVAEVVGYAEKAGLNAILNMHHDGGDSKYWLNIVKASQSDANQTAILAQITAMWTQIAEKFKDKGDFLVFESFNEIHDGKWGWGANRTDGGKQYKCLNVITSSYGSSFYEIKIEDVVEIELLDALPERLVRISGTGAETLLKGRFRASELGNLTLCLDPQCPPFLLIKTTDDLQFLFGTRDPSITEDIIAKFRGSDVSRKQ